MDVYLTRIKGKLVRHMRIDPNTLILEFEGAELHLGSQVSILDSLNFWLSILVLVGIKLEVIRQIPIVVRDN